MELLYIDPTDLHCAPEYQESSNFGLLRFACNLLADGEAAYLARIVELGHTWPDLPGVVASGDIVIIGIHFASLVWRKRL